MALLKSCCCCSLLQGSIITGVYTTVVYLAAFIMELCLVLEGENWMNSGSEKGPLPLPGYILVVLHFTIVGLSIIMLYALYQRRVGVLLAWVFIMSLLSLPELGIILFIVLFHWELTNVYGMAEIVFYLVRAPVNVLCIICVHSLYSMWRNQLETQKTLKKLSTLQLMKDSSQLSSYKNAGYLGSTSDMSTRSSKQNGVIQSYGNKYGTLPLNKSNLSGSMTSLDMQNRGSISRGYSTASQFSDYRNYYTGAQVGVEPLPGYRKIAAHTWDPYAQMALQDSRSEFNASHYPAQVSLGSMPVLSQSRSEQTIYQPHVFTPGIMYNMGPSIAYPDYGERNYDYFNMGMITKSLLDPEYTAAGYRRQMNHPDYTTQSLDRRRYLRRSHSLSVDPYSLQESYRRQANPLYYGYPRHQESKSSLGAESDDFRRYRDVAL